MINKGTLVKAIRYHKDSLGKIIDAEYLYCVVKEVNELYDPPLLLEVTLTKGEYYRFWANFEDCKFISNPEPSILYTTKEEVE